MTARRACNGAGGCCWLCCGTGAGEIWVSWTPGGSCTPRRDVIGEAEVVAGVEVEDWLG